MMAGYLHNAIYGIRSLHTIIKMEENRYTVDSWSPLQLELERKLETTRLQRAVINCLITGVEGFWRLVLYNESGALLVGSNVVGPEVNTEKMRCLFVSCQENAGQESPHMDRQ
jgi:hypothetical protein